MLVAQRALFSREERKYGSEHDLLPRTTRPPQLDDDSKKEEVLLDCSRWRLCGALPMMVEGEAQTEKDPKLTKGRTRKFSTTVCIVILLFAFIYTTVVFLVVRVTLTAF